MIQTLISKTVSVRAVRRQKPLQLFEQRRFNIENSWDFPGGAVVKNPPADAEGTGWIPGPGRSHMLRSN